MSVASLKNPWTVAEWLLLLAFTLILGTRTLPNAWSNLNTDFPNYYLASQLAHQGYDMSQAYDWRWLQREKDHRGIDQRVVGLAPITPFSTLFVWPLSRFEPLPAKHLWLLLQFALLVPIFVMLRSLTGQPLRRIALFAVACFPLHRNLLYGQFYILLLAMLVASCRAYRHQLQTLSGVLLAVAAMTKIFPVIFLLYFLRKRAWRSLLAAGLTLAVCISLSIVVFGWSMHRYYLQAVLPWTLRGEALPPYLLSSSSLSTLLHRLFIYEPQWNPHPWHNAPLLAAFLGPVLAMLLLAPAVLLVRAKARPDLVALEWSALLCATLAVSTSPASYNFTLLIFPLAVLCAHLLPKKPILASMAVLLFLGIGYPRWNTSNVDGLRAVVHEPRLIFLVALTLLCYWTLNHSAPVEDAEQHARHHLIRSPAGWSATSVFAAWVVALCLFSAAGILTGIKHQHHLYDDFAFRVPTQDDALLSADPAYSQGVLRWIDLLPTGYRLMPHPRGESASDELSFAPSTAGGWVEEVTAASVILSPAGSTITDARSPMPSFDGRNAAYIRDHLGRGQLFVQPALPLTPPGLNVLDAASLLDGSFYIAASQADGLPAIYSIQRGEAPQPLSLGPARYPSPSPDGRWLAYSGYHAGSWNLWLLDRSTKKSHRLVDASCNQVEPSWEPDSKTLLYASDCGRALGFTAICRRKVIP